MRDPKISHKDAWSNHSGIVKTSYSFAKDIAEYADCGMEKAETVFWKMVNSGNYHEVRFCDKTRRWVRK